MSLAKKQSRAIVVEGMAFRWTVSRSGQRSRTHVTLVIERAAPPRRRLLLELPCRDYFLDFPERDRGYDRVPEGMALYAPVKPARVAEMIRLAKTMGWKPDGAARPLRLIADEEGKLAEAL